MIGRLRYCARLFITRLPHLFLPSLNCATKIWVRYDYPKFVPSFQVQRCIHQAVFLHVCIQVATLVIVELILHPTHPAKLPSPQLVRSTSLRAPMPPCSTLTKIS